MQRQKAGMGKLCKIMCVKLCKDIALKMLLSVLPSKAVHYALWPAALLCHMFTEKSNFRNTFVKTWIVQGLVGEIHSFLLKKMTNWLDLWMEMCSEF